MLGWVSAAHLHYIRLRRIKDGEEEKGTYIGLSVLCNGNERNARYAP